MTDTEASVSVNDMTVSDLVKTIRERDGLSLEALGRAMGVSYVTVSHWQAGRRVPQARHLRRLRELAKNETVAESQADNRVLVICPIPDTAAALAQMIRDASSVLGLSLDVYSESDSMRALVQLGSLRPAVVFVSYPMQTLNVMHLVDGHCDVDGVNVDLYVLVSESKGNHPAVNVKKRNVVSLTTPVTLGAIGQALRQSALMPQNAPQMTAADRADSRQS